jgi:hypothetical protein
MEVEAELGVGELFNNARKGSHDETLLTKLGHFQSPSPFKIIT